jgi:translocation and assembly module TamA
VSQAAFLSRSLLTCTLALLLAAGGPSAGAAEADPTPDAPPPPPESAATPPAVKYQVTVDAPSPLKDVLVRDVGLIRWQNYAEMTEELLARLMREATDETRNAAAAQGYFSATITVTIDRRPDPAVVTLAIVPGEPTRISAVHITVTGPAATDVPLGTDAIANLTRDW